MPEQAGRASTRLPAGYEFVRPLGSGGYGAVALARQPGVGRLVAVKVLLAGNADQAERARLQREGQALALLAHPAIVRVYDLVPMDDDLALVLEYVPGIDLAAALRSGTLTVRDRLAALGFVAAALDHAAASGVVHRDVKPSNVLLADDGSVKITDFGIARLVSRVAAFRTDDGRARGTPLYMAPETLLNPDAASAAADAYSFAAMAFQVLTGVTPFGGSSQQVVEAHRSVVPPGADEVLPGFPSDAAQALAAGLAKDPWLRPSPGRLAAVLSGVPASAWGSVEAALAAQRQVRSVPSARPVTVAAPAGQATSADVAAARPVVSPSVQVPWLEPAAVSLPPVTRRPRRAPAWLVGVAAGLAIALLVLIVVTA